MSPRLALLVPMLLGAVALGVSAACWPLAGGLVVAMGVLFLIGERWELDRGRQLVTSLLGGMVGYAAAAVLFEQVPGGLTEGWTKLAAACLLASATRLPLVEAAGGPLATLLLSYGGLLALGETRHPGGYAGFVVAFLLSGLLALRVADGGGPRLSAAGARSAAGALGVIGIAVALGAGLVLMLRAAHAAEMRWARTTTAGWLAQKGFSDRIELGMLDGLIDSNTLVLRVRGPQTDYLRGAAFDLYETGRWLRSERLEKETESTWTDELPPGDAVLEINAVSERTDRFFLPLDAGPAVLSPPTLQVDGFGAVKRSGTAGLVSARVALGPRTHAIPAPPGPNNLSLTRRARGQLTQLAADWTAGATTDEEKLDAIERHLNQSYLYSTVSRSESLDPVVDFLLREKKGHCELFASGMTLMARAVRIPARFVAGYRVAERSPLDDYRLVRERNAHAWVEAWVDGRWTRRDPTPERSVPQNLPHEAGYVAATIDAIRVRYGELTAWLGRRTLAQTSLAVVVGFLALGGVIARGARSTRRTLAAARDDEAALPLLAPLLDALARQGHRRDEVEPLERLAARLPDEQAADLLRRYAALRYGDQGDAPSLAVDIQQHAARLRAAPPPPPPRPALPEARAPQEEG